MNSELIQKQEIYKSVIPGVMFSLVWMFQVSEPHKSQTV